MTRDDVTFPSGGVRCAAWSYRADRPGKGPLVIMGHGLGATRELGLDAYATRFVRAGFHVLAFDYRHYGASEGQPRELLSVGRQLDDWRAAIAFARTLPHVDASRIALWGSSFGGGHVLRIASERPGIAAAISQVPFSSGLASARRIPFSTSVRAAGAALLDWTLALLGRGPNYVGLLGRPGEVALMTAPGCYEGYRSLVPPDVEASGRWVNRVSARAALAVSFYMPARHVERIDVPVFLAVAQADSIAPAAPTLRMARRIPEADVQVLPAGHFDYYMGAGFEEVVAKEIAFLERHLTTHS